MKKILFYFLVFFALIATVGVFVNRYNNRIKNFNEITTIEDGKKRIEFVLNKWKTDFKDVLSGNGTMERNKLFFSALKTSQNCGKNYINLDNDQQEILTEFAVNTIKSDRDIIKFLKSNNLELLPAFLGEYQGLKLSHTLYNKYGEEVIINGNYVTIPQSTYTLNLKYNNSIELKITNSDSNYFYQGKYEIKNEYKTNIVKDRTGKVVENSKSYIAFGFTLDDPGKEELLGHFDYNKSSKEIDLWFGGEHVSLSKITPQNKIKNDN